MTLDQALAELKALSNEKVLQMNKKNGAHDNLFGVKLGDIRTVANKIKIDHALGLELWATGNIDARLLSTLIMKPKTFSIAELDNMVRSITFTYESEWLYAYIIKLHPDKDELRKAWMSSTDPMSARLGWSLTSGRVVREPEGIDIKALLDRIESEMPTADPLIQWTMNTTLAQIGICHPEYRERALAIGEKLGIYRDYPVPKGCTSPFAPIWINEMVKRQG
jgi:3-methyladenine DNA glycosylase AlkD